MPERTMRMLQVACLVLAALLVFQIAWVAVQLRPLSRVTIPELPSLPRETANQSGPNPTLTMAGSGRGQGSNSPAHGAMTNAMSNAATLGTNALAAGLAASSNSTPAQIAAGSNGVPLAVQGMAVVNPAPTNVWMTNGTNAMLTAGATNRVSTNLANSRAGGPGALPPGIAMGGRGFNPQMMMGGMKPVELPPAIQARVNRIIDSELLGTVMHPQPMALVGIAGNQVILRTPSGQTGLVRLGDELGGVKLLSIGINRVLVEDQGEKKELTIFSGFGSDSLLSKQDTSHETNK